MKTGSKSIFFKSGFNCASLRLGDTSPVDVDRLITAVMYGATSWTCLFRSCVNIGSKAHDLGGVFLISLTMESSSTSSNLVSR